MGEPKMCSECGERPALGARKKDGGRLHDTCGLCAVALAEAGVDITQPKPKPPSKREQKAADRQHKLDIIEQRAQRRKQEDQAERGYVPEADPTEEVEPDNVTV